MEIIILKTHEISNAQWIAIVEGFNSSFERHDTTKKILFESYIANDFGYSYHALCFDEDKIVGFNTIIPRWYFHNDERILLGLSGSTYVLKEYRKNIFIFSDMYNALKKQCAKENIKAILGVPNENSYKYSIILLKCKEIFNLSYYMLPLNISRILNKRWLRCLDLFSWFYCILAVALNLIISYVYNSKEKSCIYRLDTNRKSLLNRFSPKHYTNYNKGNYDYSYTICLEGSIRTAYIMDFREKGRKSLIALLKCILHILFHEKIDTIMYVGTMNLSQIILIKVPSMFEPQKLRFTVNQIKLTKNDESYFDMLNRKSWDFSLLNLDVR